MNFLTIGCLVLGYLLGESGLGLFNVYTIGHLKPFIAFALGWVGFIIGENLEFSTVRRMSAQLLILSLGQLTAAFVLTGWALWWFLSGPAGWPAGTALVFSLLAACTATATDPITAAALMDRGRRAAGLSHLLMQLATIADVLTTLLFWLVLSFSVNHIGSGVPGGFGFTVEALLHPALGLALGLALSLLITPERDQREVTLLFMAALFIAVGAGMAIRVSPLIVCMFASAFVMSVKRGKTVIREVVHQLEMPVYVTFLIMCGALFKPPLLVDLFWPLLIYVALRAVGKTGGIFITAKAMHLEPGAPRLGLGLLSQAGLAVVLAVNIYFEVDAALGLNLIALTTAGIVVNQLLGIEGMKLLKSTFEEEE
ncbi:MAG: cation:proton antiporter [bacterium]|nr:cation:proton antiporter [bacterium]MDT8396409.1 cation:proton antiporter [bacterium]